MELLDLRHFDWSATHNKITGSAGAFFKDKRMIDGINYYYKLSSYNEIDGITGHESILEVLVYNYIKLMGLKSAAYEPIYGIVELAGNEYKTILCRSPDFREPGESKISFNSLYKKSRKGFETTFECCVRNGLGREIEIMFLIDFLIINKDRHGGNIEILKNSKGDLRIAPLFDNGYCLTADYKSEEAVKNFDYKSDIAVRNAVGTDSLFKNLKFISSPIEVNALVGDEIENLVKSTEGISDLRKKVIIEALEWRLEYARLNNFIRERF